MSWAEFSPSRCCPLTGDDLVDPRARGRRYVGRQFGDGKEPGSSNLRIASLFLYHRERAHHIDDDMITAGCVGVEENPVQHRNARDFDPAFLP